MENMSNKPDDIAGSPLQAPVQPSNIVFPVTSFSGKGRSFNPAWFSSYKWLEYSVKCDACFCYPCRLFGSGGGPASRPVQVFTVTGFKSWKHATGKHGSLAVHDACSSHRQAVIAWDLYMHTQETGVTVADQLGTARAQLVKKNRHRIKMIAKILLLCARQDIALRGHRESADSSNRGNFLEILTLATELDGTIDLSASPQNALYTSPDIQNELLHVIGNRIRRMIASEVKKSTYFSILSDETKDLSKQEQVTLVIRYVDMKSCTIYERFLSFVHAEAFDAASFSSYILGLLSEYELDIKGLVSQGYDGASVMSGKYSGVQRQIREVAPQAFYVHCQAHCLNLVLVDCAKIVPQASEFFHLLQNLYVFISTSKAHEIFMSKQLELHPDKQTRQLQRLSDTRWACRHDAVDAVCSTYDSLLATLMDIVDGDDKAKAVEANGILLQIHSVKFILLLVMFLRILSCTRRLSDQLQLKDIDMSKAAELVSATMEILCDFRNDYCWEQIVQHTKQVAVANHVNIYSSRPRRTQSAPQRFCDSVVMETTGLREDISYEQLKTSIYLPLIDCLLSEMNRRFSSDNLSIMQAMQSCHPKSSTFLNPEKLLPIIENYSLNKDSLAEECPLAKRTLQNKDIASVYEVLVELSPLRNAFPNLLSLLQIILTIAISSSSCERTFSSLKRIKTWLRTTMTERRLVDLATISIERDLSYEVSLDEVVTDFAGVAARRIILS